MIRLTLIAVALLNLYTLSQAQWQRQYPLPKLEEVLDIVVKNDGYGFATGSDDLALRFNNGTKEWQILPDSEFGWTLFAVDYLSGSDGEYVAAGGTGLIVSENGGYNWTKIQDAPAGVQKIKILDENLIIVIAGNGVHRWNGNFWTSLNLPANVNVIGGHILDADHIWAYTGGTNPEIHYTSNGGTNWSTNAELDRPDAVLFYDTQFGVAFDNRRVYHSVNGGANWTEVSSNAIHNSISDVTFGETANILMAATLNGDPAISLDSGDTWDQIEMDLLNTRSYSIANIGNEYWVGNDLSSIGYTPDSGGGWSERSGPRREPVHDVHFINRNLGFAVGFDGLLLKTENGGSTWNDIAFESDRHYWSMHGNLNTNLWIGANQRIYSSADTGRTWSVKATFLGGGINDILAISASRILGVTSAGIILRSNDAGASWDTVHQVATQLRSIARIDNQRYLATGFNGIILRSNDQGETWTPLTAPVPNLQYEQSYWLDNTGWLITSSFQATMWKTTNAGDNWTPITLPIDRFWNGVFFITQDTGIIVGSSATEGRAYITYNGGTNWQPSYVTDYALLGVSGVNNPNGTAWIHGAGADIEILPYCTDVPTIANLQGDFDPCQGDTVTFTLTGTNVDLYQWFFPTGWSIIGNSNNDTIRVRVGVASGNVSVTGVNACGFTNALISQLTPTPIPVLNTITGPASPCQGEAIVYSVNGSGADHFAWTVPAGWTIVSGQSSNTITVTVGGVIGNINVDGGNVCGDDSATPLHVTPSLLPVGTLIDGNPSPCIFGLAAYTFVGENTDSVFWELPVDWTILDQPDAFTIIVQAGFTGGTITAVGQNECGLSQPITFDVAIQDPPVISLSFDEGTNILSPVFSGNIISITWFFEGEELLNEFEPTLLATESGNYQVLLVFDDGCISISEPLDVIISSTDNAVRDADIWLMPNPATSFVTIAGLPGASPFEIYDMRGSLCRKGITADRIGVQDLADGLYTVRIILQDRIVVKQLVITK
jgi:photosystem II stability/assembly factor-like uncharacterized protein